MNFKEYKQSLVFRKYKNWKIIVRFIEYKLKDYLIYILINFNRFKFNKKKIVDLGSFKDNSYINFLLYSLKEEYNFAYNNDKNAKKLFKRIGFLNFFKHTIANSNLKNNNLIKINMNPFVKDQNKILIDTNYFKYIYDKDKLSQKNNLIMPYFMYPRIYNSFYKKINIISKPNFKLRVFFSGSVVEEGYSNFFWRKEPKKFPNRVKIIESILKEFKSEIFLINSKNDLKQNDIFKKKIILCLHNKVMKKTSYKLSFKDNFKLLNNSCFNLNCPGVVMPLCHHLIEGIKVGSIPITNCENLIIPNLDNSNSLQYSSIDQLLEKTHIAIKMEDDKILNMRSNVQKYYKDNLAPEIFKQNFNKALSNNQKKIICCDDHRSIDGMI